MFGVGTIRRKLLPPTRRSQTSAAWQSAPGGISEPQKMKKSGNEAKKYLKKKDLTFLNGAN